MYFSAEDRQLIETLEYNPSLKPGYEALKGCLVWDDEGLFIVGLSEDGREKLADLWIARLILFHDLDRHTLDDSYFKDAWNLAVAQLQGWPGFNRLVLSAEDRAFYEHCLTNASEL